MNKKNEHNRVEYCRKSIGDIFIIAVTAAAAGLVIGLLFAPEAGLKTRKVLNKAIKEMIDRSKFAAETQTPSTSSRSVFSNPAKHAPMAYFAQAIPIIPLKYN